MRRVFKSLVLVFVLVFVGVSFGEEKQEKHPIASEQGNLYVEYIKTVRVKDIAYSDHEPSVVICGNYIAVATYNGPVIMDYVKNTEAINLIKYLGLKVQQPGFVIVRDYSPDCNYAFIEDEIERKIYIFNMKERKLVATFKFIDYLLSPDGKKLVIVNSQKYKNKVDKKLPFELIQILENALIEGWFDNDTIVLKKAREHYLFSLDNKKIRKLEFPTKSNCISFWGFLKNGILYKEYRSGLGDNDCYLEGDVYYYDLDVRQKKKILSDVPIHWIRINYGYIFFVNYGNKFTIPYDIGIDDKIMYIDLNATNNNPQFLYKFKQQPEDFNFSERGKLMMAIIYRLSNDNYIEIYAIKNRRE